MDTRACEISMIAFLIRRLYIVIEQLSSTNVATRQTHQQVFCTFPNFSWHSTFYVLGVAFLLSLASVTASHARS